MEFVFNIGGEAGQGVQTLGAVLARCFSLGGLHLFADQDYESRVRGGHNFFRIRVNDNPVQAIDGTTHILIALNQETIDLHRGELAPQGVLLCDSDKIKSAASDSQCFGLPLERLSQEKAGNKLMVNSVATGAAVAMVGYDFDVLAQALRQQFRSAGEAVVEANVTAARAGYEQARQQFKADLGRGLRPTGDQKRMLSGGNEAIALGAIAAGCKFMSSYPMTPTTSIMEYMAGKAAEYGMVVLQAEDEIAALNMVAGACFAGVRAIAATSGGGFSLMVEALGLAGMTETPVVVIEGQRGGPATGLPTRTEQGDLEFMIHAAQGEFARAVLAPVTVEDCFWSTVHAFNLAERYQTPVIVATDHHLATSYTTLEPFDLSRVVIDRGQLLSEAEAGPDYKKYLLTPSGISPRALPGYQNALVVACGDEHDEEGHIIEDARTRSAMVTKRLAKLQGMKQEALAPLTYGPAGAEVTLIGWGGTYGALAEAVDMLNRDGLKANLVHLGQVWPLPAEAIAKDIAGARRTFVVENSAMGQLAHLIRAETGIQATDAIRKFDGRPFTPANIVDQLRKEVAV